MLGVGGLEFEGEEKLGGGIVSITLWGKRRKWNEALPG